MEFVKINNGVQFYYSADRSLNVSTGKIDNIIVKNDISGNKVLLIYVGTMENPIKVEYSKVTSPVTADADELRGILLLWNNDILQKEEFTATAAQTVFTTTFVLQANVNFYIGGTLQPTFSYSYTSGTHTLTWSGAAFGGGEEVVIETW